MKKPILTLAIAAVLVTASLPATASPEERAYLKKCAEEARELLMETRPLAEKVGRVDLSKVQLSQGVYFTQVGSQDFDRYTLAEYSRDRIYLFTPFCKKSRQDKRGVIAHELGHAIEDILNPQPVNGIEIAPMPSAWEDRPEERKAERWRVAIQGVGQPFLASIGFTLPKACRLPGGIIL